MFRYTAAFFLLLIIGITTACKFKNADTDDTVHSGYSLGRPYVQKLPPELDEASGLEFIAKDSSLLSVGDERGYIYKIHPAFPNQIERWKFAGDGDYEDICSINDTIYVLKSNGDVYAVKIDAEGTNTRSYDFPYEKGEFESLYYDSAIAKLVLIAKDYEPDKKKSLSIFYFDPYSHFYSRADKKMQIEPIADALDKKKIRFKPSAAAIHPITGHLFMISAVNNVLVEALTDGTVTSVFQLDKAIFKQPEGLTFSPKGTMFISNEAAGVGVANVLIYTYKVQK